jgi:hypothetical protein
VRTLGAVVLPFGSSVEVGKAQVAKRGIVGPIRSVTIDVGNKPWRFSSLRIKRTAARPRILAGRDKPIFLPCSFLAADVRPHLVAVSTGSECLNQNRKLRRTQ